MYYGTEPWVVKSQVTVPAVDVLQYLARPWRLSLLFLISGAATAFLIAKTPRNFLLDRSRRLLVPLVFAMLAIIPIHRYYQAIEHAGYAGNYLEFWKSYLTLQRNVCSVEKCYDVFTFSHLWFVAYLWVFTVLLWVFKRWTPRIVDAARLILVRETRGLRVLLWPLLLFVGLRLLLRDLFPPNFRLIGDWYRDAIFFAAFAFGFLVVHERSVWLSIRQSRWVALALWLGASLALTWMVAVFGLDGPPEPGLHYLEHVVYGISQWSCVVAVLGLTSNIEIHDSAARRYFTDAIFPYYIVHYAAIVVISRLLWPWSLPTAMEALVLIAGTIATCAATYAVVRRVRWLRPLFGLRPTAKAT